MLRETFFGILRDEGMMKNIFSGIGYFILSGAIFKLIISGGSGNITVGISAAILALSMLMLASFFWIIHVIRPIIRITWPDFGIPGLDEGVDKVPYKLLLKRQDIYAFVFLASLSLYVGWTIFRILIVQSSS